MNSCTAEVLAIDCYKSNLIIVATYRHPNSDVNDFTNDLDTILGSEKLSVKDKSYILCGDININVLSNNKTVEKYTNIMNAYAYKSFINVPTLVKENSSSCIDHIWGKPSKHDNIKAEV